MFNTNQEFLDFINANGGPSQLMMLMFNNSYNKVYGEGEVFNPTADFDLNNGMIKIIERDIKGKEYIVYKNILYLESLIFAPVGVDKDTIYHRSFRA